MQPATHQVRRPESLGVLATAEYDGGKLLMVRGRRDTRMMCAALTVALALIVPIGTFSVGAATTRSFVAAPSRSSAVDPTCNVAPLGVASAYQVFVLGDVSENSTDTQGAEAIGGNATLTSFGVGDHLPDPSPTDARQGFSLVVGGNLTFTNGGINYGNGAVGGTQTISNVVVPSGTIQAATPINFAAAQTQLLNVSAAYAAYPANGSALTTTIPMTPGDYLLTLSGTDPNLNIISVSGTVLSGATDVSVKAPKGSTVLLNIDGATNSLNATTFLIDGPSPDHILYNYYQATSLTLFHIGFPDSILAPQADASFTYGVYYGSLITKSLNVAAGSGNTYGEFDVPPGFQSFVLPPFQGCVPRIPPGATTPPTPGVTTTTVPSATATSASKTPTPAATATTIVLPTDTIAPPPTSAPTDTIAPPPTSAPTDTAAPLITAVPADTATPTTCAHPETPSATITSPTSFSGYVEFDFKDTTTGTVVYSETVPVTFVAGASQTVTGTPFAKSCKYSYDLIAKVIGPDGRVLGASRRHGARTITLVLPKQTPPPTTAPTTLPKPRPTTAPTTPPTTLPTTPPTAVATSLGVQATPTAYPTQTPYPTPTAYPTGTPYPTQVPAAIPTIVSLPRTGRFAEVPQHYSPAVVHGAVSANVAHRSARRGNALAATGGSGLSSSDDLVLGGALAFALALLARAVYLLRRR